MHLLAYNLIRGVMPQAAEAHGREPRQLSFKGALQTMTAFHEALGRATPEQRERLVAVMLKAIAGHRVGDRPGRVEPRANKRRPNRNISPSRGGRLANGWWRMLMKNPCAIRV